MVHNIIEYRTEATLHNNISSVGDYGGYVGMLH